ncbi:MAG: Maf family protein, partial [Myxococcota bacterium]
AVEEVKADHETPAGYTERLALEKALDVAKRTAHEHSLPAWIVAADTVVVLDGVVLEKPADAEDAKRMLRALAGRGHVVTTAYCVLERHTGTHRVCAISADVRLYELTQDIIERYVATGEPMDKAGAYGIQGVAAAFVERIEGSYSAIVGLPLAHLARTMVRMGALAAFPLAPTTLEGSS